MNCMAIIACYSGRSMSAVLVWMGTRVAGQTTIRADFRRLIVESDDPTAGGVCKVLPCVAVTARAFSVCRCVDRASGVISVTGRAGGVLGKRSAARQ